MSRVDEVDALGDKWQVYEIFHHGLANWMKVTGETNVAKSPYYGSTVEEIDWLKKVEVQAAAQKWICSSISNTCNLPKHVQNSDVDNLCMHAWETGCKGITVYRKGSRDAVITDENESLSLPSEITENHAPKRPKDLECDIHRVNVKGQAYLVLVGLLGNKPYEVFAGLSEHVEVPRKAKKGILVKNGKKDGIATYNLRIPLADDDVVVFKDVVSLFENSLYGAFTRTISLALRHGVSPQFLVDQLKKDKHSDITSFSACIARVMKNYIQDGTISTEKCPQCGGQLSYQQGCVGCTSCSFSKCG